MGFHKLAPVGSKGDRWLTTSSDAQRSTMTMIRYFQATYNCEYEYMFANIIDAGCTDVIFKIPRANKSIELPLLDWVSAFLLI